MRVLKKGEGREFLSLCFLESVVVDILVHVLKGEGKGISFFFYNYILIYKYILSFFFESIDILDIKGRREGNFFLSLCFLESVVACAYIKEGKGEGNFSLSLCFLKSIDILMRILRKGKGKGIFFFLYAFSNLSIYLICVY